MVISQETQCPARWPGLVALYLLAFLAASQEKSCCALFYSQGLGLVAASGTRQPSPGEPVCLMHQGLPLRIPVLITSFSSLASLFVIHNNFEKLIKQWSLLSLQQLFTSFVGLSALYSCVSVLGTLLSSQFICYGKMCLVHFEQFLSREQNSLRGCLPCQELFRKFSYTLGSQHTNISVFYFLAQHNFMCVFPCSYIIFRFIILMTA